jgi:hypothetical protein
MWVAGLGLACAATPDLAGAGRERIAVATSPADLRLDTPRAQLLAERFGVVATVGPELLGALAAGEQLVDQRQQVALFVLVAGRDADGERGAVAVDD